MQVLVLKGFRQTNYGAVSFNRWMVSTVVPFNEITT